MSFVLVPGTIVSADAALSEIYTNAPVSIGDYESWDVTFKLKTSTAGAGTLLVTLQYNDGEGTQDITVGLALTAGAYSVNTFSGLWRKTSEIVSIKYEYQAAIVDGECEVYIVIQC